MFTISEQLKKKSIELKLTRRFSTIWIVLNIVVLIIIIFLYYYNIIHISDRGIIYVLGYYFSVILSLFINYYIYIPGLKKEKKNLERQLKQIQEETLLNTKE